MRLAQFSLASPYRACFKTVIERDPRKGGSQSGSKSERGRSTYQSDGRPRSNLDMADATDRQCRGLEPLHIDLTIGRLIADVGAVAALIPKLCPPRIAGMLFARIKVPFLTND